MHYCPDCGSASNVGDKYCRSCGFHLDVEPREAQIPEAKQKVWKKKWFLGVMGALLVGLTIGVVLLINNHSSVQDIDVSLAKATLNSYLGYAAQQDEAAMWNMIHPESQILYNGFNDFASNNGITNYLVFYELNNWNVESAQKISSWRTYSNVVVCKVNLDYKLHPLADIANWVFLGGIAPSEQKATTTLFLVKEGDQWKIFSEHSSGSTNSGAGTPTYALTTSVSPSGAGSVTPSGGEYQSGELVTLIATPATGYTFDHWSGSASGTASTITISMNSDKSLTANFKGSQAPSTEPIRITATHLYDEYRTDRSRADLDYKGQVLEVSGTIRYVNTFLVYWVSLDADLLNSVYCHFDSSWEPQLDELKTGQHVTIEGTCDGADLWGDPQLRDCKIT